NAVGIELADPLATDPLLAAIAQATAPGDWTAAPLIDGIAVTGPTQVVLDPTDNRRTAGQVVLANESHILSAVDHAVAAAPDWDRVPAAERAACLERAADLFEQRMPAFMAMAIREAGKTIPDALAELRETIDFLRYYAGSTRTDFGKPMALPGPTGELNEISLHGRGVFVCVSPWNFPLAIFCGQVAAALAAGNTVVAKPAEQTPLIAFAAVRLLHEAGIPTAALSLLPGGGETGAALISDPRIAGVAFTGSTETARLINRALADREGAIVPLIAETGGQNVMLVDSSALPEQVVDDVVASAFGSAGQRCSALRVLFVQQEIADSLLAMLTGAMAELTVGDPAFLATDIGPVIDQTALSMLQGHVVRMEEQAKPLYQGRLAAATEHGTFMAPQLFEIDSLSVLEREVFGPVLHVIRYAAADLDRVIADVNATGYGLTLGVHSRIDATAERIVKGIRAGNAYVNRNIIGAVVGVQPFGGEGLSGTGPKAGGPRYLHRFATERTRSVNTTAAGGNAALMSLLDSDSDTD
ncbi:MAG: bifunctional proline dehydrogenase/L-glutamate gamma-semialdehyde dehydrogenase PutA, partial [Alphaproteobacteria bacterium]